MTILATVALFGLLVTCSAVALHAHRELRQWHAEEEDHFDAVIRDLEQVQEAVRITWSMLYRPRLADHGPQRLGTVRAPRAD